jgi:hypothetical protein
MRRGVGDALEGFDRERQAELARALGEDTGVAEAGEPRRDRLLREADADVRADAGRLTAGQCDARQLVGPIAQIFLTT